VILQASYVPKRSCLRWAIIFKAARLSDPVMTSELIRAARSLLRWEQTDLSEKSGVSLSTIKRLELKAGTLVARPPTVTALQSAFERIGIEFTNGDAPGVRLHKKPPDGPAELGRLYSRIEAQGLADEAIDEALANLDATAQEKAQRRGKLKDYPKIFKSILGSDGDDG
jgi:transcriptional regulator with XRE-family HTH domain